MINNMDASQIDDIDLSKIPGYVPPPMPDAPR